MILSSTRASETPYIAVTNADVTEKTDSESFSRDSGDVHADEVERDIARYFSLINSRDAQTRRKIRSYSLGLTLTNPSEDRWPRSRCEYPIRPTAN